MQVVTPFRPFEPESDEHLALGPFDWIGAIGMLRESVRRSCGCETLAITDVDTTLPGPVLQFETRERRLMLWILEVSLRFLESAHFDRDTVMVSPDTLIVGPLQPYFMGDIAIIVRPGAKYAARPIINSVQWWPHDSKKRLVAFYRQALDIARALPEPFLTWGADSEPIRRMVTPIAQGIQRRSGLRACLIPMEWVMSSLRSGDIDLLEQGGTPPRPPVPIVDFRYTRKRYMPAYFDAVLGGVR